jgi:DNA-binding NtrC family response regulator
MASPALRTPSVPSQTDGRFDLIGVSPVAQALKDQIERVALSDTKVLVTGESGSGKELVARTLHQRSPRARRVFVAVNCAGLPETLLESELFGHVKGSFTGAYRDRPGKLEQVDGGTIFLDEVGEMSLRMQGLLLRFLETGEIQKVGSDAALRRVDARVIGATHRNLRELIALGLFREDLFYRLNVLHIEVPPLREHKEDIPLLVEHFLERASRTTDTAVHAFSPDAMAMLSAYAWPGNVRELANVVERIAVTCRKELAEPEDLPEEVAAARATLRPKFERRRTIADELYTRLTENGESFWTAVYPLYMRRDLTRGNIRELVRRGLRETRGNYRMLTRLFNMPPRHYKRFLNFLRKHGCQLPYRDFR